MGDVGEVYQALRDMRKRTRAVYGVECPRCRQVRPRTNAAILLPGQRCKVDGHRDPRPPLTDEQIQQMTDPAHAD